MKTTNLFLTALLSGSLLAGCIDLSSDEKEKAAAVAAGLLDDFAEENNEEVSTSEALDKNYIDDTVITEDSAAGSANIGGEVDIASFSRSLSKMAARSSGSRAQHVSRAVDTISTSDFTVSYIDGNGQTVIINIAAERINLREISSGNTQFVITGMGDGINYIVEVAVTVDSQTVKLKSVAFIPEGDTRSEKASIDPISTVVAEAVQDKVVNSFFETGGDTLSQDYINDMLETLAVAVEKVLESNPDFTASDFEAAVNSDGGVDALVTKLLSDDNVSGEINKLEDAAVADDQAVPVEFADEGTLSEDEEEEVTEQARNIVEELLTKDEENGDDGTPQFFIDFFGDQFRNGTTKTVDKIVTAIFQGIREDIDIDVLKSALEAEANKGDASDFTAQELVFIENKLAELDALIAVEDQGDLSDAQEENADSLFGQLSRLNLRLQGLSKDGALNAFTQELFDLYDAIDEVAKLEAVDNRTESENNELHGLRGEISEASLLLGIFPPEDKATWQTLSGASPLNVPQAISLILFTLDVYFEPLQGFERNDEGQLEETEGVDFDHIKLLVLYGFDTSNLEQQAEYANLEVNWLDVHPGRIWINTLNEGQGGEVDVLNLSTCVDAYPQDDIFTVNSVTLSYPTSTGTETIRLKNEAEFQASHDSESDDNHKGNCFSINPWSEGDILSREDRFKDTQGNVRWDDIWNQLDAEGKLVTDFTSGNYVLTVKYLQEGGEAGEQTYTSKTFNKTIITGLQNLTPRFTSPQGLPPSPNNGASQAEWTAFNEAQSAFNITTFSLATNSDEVELDYAAPIIFTWDEPALLADTPLPEGVVAAYSLDIGRDVCGEDNPDTDENESYCHWEHIFSSWDLGSQIFDTSFALPEEALTQLTALAIEDSPYQVNLNINFMNEATGEFLGNGGWAGAPFRVGVALNLDDTFTLTGIVSNAPGDSETDENGTAYDIGLYKVAMVSERCFEDTSAEPETHQFFDEEGNIIIETYLPWICENEILAVSDSITVDTENGGHSYSLQPTLRQAMGSGQNAWIDIRLFIDIDENGVIDQDHETGNHEPQFWSQGGVHFNSWGGVLRINKDSCDNNENCTFSEEIVIPGETFYGPEFNVSPHFDGGNDTGGNDTGGDGNGDGNGNGNGNGDAGGDAGGGEDDEPTNLTNQLTPGGSFTDATLSWAIDGNAAAPLAAADIDGYRVILFEVDPTTLGSDDEPSILSALIAHVDASTDSITMSDMLNGTNGAENVTAAAISENNEGWSAITNLADVVNTKGYFWFVEALGANGDDIGESHGFALGAADPNPPQ